MNKLTNFITIPSSDPDDSRRRKLLNILLLGIAILLILAILFISVVMLTQQNQPNYDVAGTRQLLVASVFLLLGMVIIFFLNRYWSGRFAASVFLTILTLVFIAGDNPTEISTGRSLFIFTIPIIIASVLLKPASSFIFSGLSSIIISVIAISIDRIPNIPAIGGYFVVALISWLSARNLEQTLQDLRQINTNLDQIVKERTHALAEALTRERIEAGRSQAILESIADGVVVFDTKGNAIQANPALSHLINVPINDILNASVNHLVESSPMDAKNKGTLAGLLTKPSEQLSSHRVVWGQKTLSVSSSHVLDRDSSEVGTVAVFRDFTKEAGIEKMKSAFVAMVSHELRTPLSAILGYAEIFLEQIYGALNEKQTKMVIRIVSNTRRLLNLINDLLDQAQMEAGKLKIKYEMIKPSHLLENLHGVMDKITEDKGLTLTSELDPELPTAIKGDSARLQQILVNLVNNAVKFTKEGSVHVKLSLMNKQEWGIAVSDTGMGIPKDELPNIFDSFRQVEGTTIREHGGFGLGLSIVKQLVSLMGGNISVDSELGKGSTFYITLPLETKE
jgi:signal transduction histidine kinase